MNQSPDASTDRPSVALYILSRDRSELCRAAVASAVAQTYANLKLVLSDNSTTEDVMHMMHQEFPSVQIIRRRPQLAAIEHFNAVLNEVRADYFVLFHDDDVMSEDFIEKMVLLLLEQPDAAACGCNATIIRRARKTEQRFMGSFRGTRLLKDAAELVGPYLELTLIGPAPFPGYVYRTSAVRGLRMESEMGGKHTDVSFLLSVLGRAPILWTSECLFFYRFHGKNDSSQESIADRLIWLRHIFAVTGILPKSRAVRDYKFLYWLRWISQNRTTDAVALKQHFFGYKRVRVATIFVLMWGLRLMFTRRDFWIRAIRYVRYRFTLADSSTKCNDDHPQ